MSSFITERTDHFTFIERNGHTAEVQGLGNGDWIIRIDGMAPQGNTPAMWEARQPLKNRGGVEGIAVRALGTMEPL